MDEQRRRNSCLPRDVLGDILSRIAGKRLVQWRLVSKSWGSLINEIVLPLPFLLIDTTLTYRRQPIARLNHHKREKGKLAQRFIPLNPIFNFLPTPIYGYERNVMSFCNGLYLLCDKEEETSNLMYIVCDYATKIATIIPDPPKFHSYTLLDIVTLLAFNPRESPYYRVLAWYRFSYTCRDVFLSIYYSKTNKWTPPKLFEYVNFFYSYRTNSKLIVNDHMNTFFNGEIYLYNIDNIVSVDVATGSSRLIALPEGVQAQGKTGFFHMGLLRWRMCFAQLDGLAIKVWRMQDDEMWAVTHYKSDAMATKYRGKEDVPRIVAFHPLSDVVLIKRSSALSFYDTRHSRLENVCSLFAGSMSFLSYMMVEPFSPNLIDNTHDHNEDLQTDSRV